MSAEHIPGGIESGITVVAAPTENGDLLVSRGERTLGVVLREAGGLYAYPCVSGFPRLGPFDRVALAVTACVEQAEAPERTLAAENDEGELVFGEAVACPNCGSELVREGERASSYASCRSCDLVFLR
ncbi:hypothetical protein [Naasia sp. SYSU D00057]|uniref:hypothetical protein n=1 Tax=Naasia sp. SYSU D00057 TaxID=2817380 RepID=UPI001B316370|nr:hypothetical protein [Naasia sp. SYSU D00057]